MPTFTQLNSCDGAAFAAALGHLFEHSPWVAEETWRRRHCLRGVGEASLFRDVPHLFAELCATMRGATRERQLALIRAHPDLADRLAQEGKLTAESVREQASAGLNSLPPAERAEFQRRNAAYRAQFGFPFIICARLHDRATIAAAMQARLHHTPDEEFQTALGEIEKIARLRLDDVLEPDPGNRS